MAFREAYRGSGLTILGGISAPDVMPGQAFRAGLATGQQRRQNELAMRETRQAMQLRSREEQRRQQAFEQQQAAAAAARARAAQAAARNQSEVAAFDEVFAGRSRSGPIQGPTLPVTAPSSFRITPSVGVQPTAGVLYPVVTESAGGAPQPTAGVAYPVVTGGAGDTALPGGGGEDVLAPVPGVRTPDRMMPAADAMAIRAGLAERPAPQLPPPSEFAPERAVLVEAVEALYDPVSGRAISTVGYTPYPPSAVPQVREAYITELQQRIAQTRRVLDQWSAIAENPEGRNYAESVDKVREFSARLEAEEAELAAATAEVAPLPVGGFESRGITAAEGPEATGQAAPAPAPGAGTPTEAEAGAETSTEAGAGAAPAAPLPEGFRITPANMQTLSFEQTQEPPAEYYGRLPQNLMADQRALRLNLDLAMLNYDRARNRGDLAGMQQAAQEVFALEQQQLMLDGMSALATIELRGDYGPMQLLLAQQWQNNFSDVQINPRADGAVELYGDGQLVARYRTPEEFLADMRGQYDQQYAAAQQAQAELQADAARETVMAQARAQQRITEAQAQAIIDQLTNLPGVEKGTGPNGETVFVFTDPDTGLPAEAYQIAENDDGTLSIELADVARGE